MLALRSRAPTLPPDKILRLGAARKNIRQKKEHQQTKQAPPQPPPPPRQEPRIPSPKLVPVCEEWLKPSPLHGDLTGCLEPLEGESNEEPERASPVEPSSPPPGFGPQRTPSPPTSVHPLVAQYRTRIARGPDMTQNFAARIKQKNTDLKFDLQPTPNTYAAIERLRAAATANTQHIFAEPKPHLAPTHPSDARAVPHESEMLAKWFNEISVENPVSTSPNPIISEPKKSRDDQLGYNVMSFFNSVKKQSAAGIMDNKPKPPPVNRAPEVSASSQLHQHRVAAPVSIPFAGRTMFPPPPLSQPTHSAPNSLGIGIDPAVAIRGHPIGSPGAQQVPNNDAAQHLLSLFANAERGSQNQLRKPQPMQQRPMYPHMPPAQQTSHPQHLFMQQPHAMPVVGRPQAQPPAGLPEHIRLAQMMQQQQQSRIMHPSPPPQHIMQQARIVPQQHLHRLVAQQHFPPPPPPGINGTRPAPGATFVGGPYGVKHPIPHVPVAVPVPAVASVASATATATTAPPHNETSAATFDLQQWFQKLSSQQAQNQPTHAQTKQ